ncbi:MAG: hypothetical protein DMG04_13335 [Acidobacteria bacterium]|nr:MAG: hypothetical protein DMG04_13335 [Acidobacteriota bacterium]PYQ84192.1 MAG: hypothetical protein DMG02_31895 [Acidobacteriota bacterium]PYR10351.1 MAG: hypothetical protein DMF99_12210 [Acidobacteriota bacterium]
MLNVRTVGICAFGIVFATHGLDGQGLSQYRNFALGSDVASISILTGGTASEAKTIHKRPALLQDLEWRPSRWILGSVSPSTDAVRQIVFSFYDDRLFRIVVDYDHERTEGLTDADMIDAISAVYGTRLTRTSGRAARVVSRVEIESGSSVAKWGDAGHVVALYRTASYGDAFRLIVTDSALAALARKAEVRAARLDAQEAPSREIARQKKERDDGRAAAEKARVANKGAFRP